MNGKKTAVITGGAGGLGLALTDALTSQGWCVCLLDLSGAKLTAAGNQDGVSVFPCDVTSPVEVATVSKELISRHPTIDLVIYNAGITQIGELTAAPIEAHQKVFDVNYFGALHLLREMIAPIRQSNGTHLAISSVAGFAPLYHRTAYSASKHALEGLFKSLRAEELSHDVYVAIASPSFVATNIGNPGNQSDGIARPGSAEDGMDYMSPDKAAMEILSGLQRKKPYIPIGRVARLSWRIARFAPELYFRLMMKRIASK